MSSILLTPYDGAILGPIAKLLGWILNGIYSLLSLIGIENVGLSIILLTIVIYTCMLPLNYKQQKFSKLSQKMQPELKKIQDKYKGKKDQESVMAMNQETQLLYQKYGISPSGSCVQLIIQMPILFALYRVFYNVPAYIGVVKDKFIGIADEIVHVDGFADTMSEIVKNFKINLSTKPDFVITDSNTIDNVKNFVVDVLYKVPSVETLVTPNADGKVYFEGLNTVTQIVENGVEEFYNFNYFLGLNISDTPWNIIVENFNAKNYLLVFGALMIPVLAYLTQVLSIKLMQAKNNPGDQMAQQMKMMNTFMPFMSLIMCFSVPVGLGIYWIVSAAYRVPQQLLLNRHFDKMDLEALIKKNEAKAAKKIERMKASYENVSNYAAMKTKGVNDKASYVNTANKEEALKKANDYYSKNAKPGSIAAKANMVKEYNEKNSR